MPGLLASIYDKAARMVIDSYYIPTAEEVIVLLSQINTGSLETDRRILVLGTGPGYLLIEIAKRVHNFQIHGIDPLPKSIRIARRNVLGLFTLTERNRFLFGRGELHGRETGLLVRPITKRLFLRPAAPAPIVRSRF